MHAKGLIFCTALLLTMSCQKDNSKMTNRGQELKINIHSEPPSMDSRKASDVSSISLIKMCFEGLTRIGRNGEPELALAREVKVSEDKKIYTFFLRDASWSDGHPITAYDFEETWRTMLSPTFPCPFSYDLYILKNGKEAKEGKCKLEDTGVKALDSMTLEVELAHSCPYFLDLVAGALFYPVPCHIDHLFPNWAENADEHFVVNGPFSLKSWRHYNDMVLEKNQAYWDAESVKLDRIVFYMIEDENTELSMFDNNQLDWAGNPLSTLPIDALPTLSKKKNLERYPISGTYYYIFNTQLFPFNNVNMRKAFALAINRMDIIENVTQGGQLPATGLIPPTIWKHECTHFKDADISEARRLFNLALQEMGISRKDLPPINLIYNTLQAHHKIAQAIQQQWKEALGVTVRLENKEWKVYLDELTTKNFHIARMGGIASFNDPTSFLDLYKYASLGHNYSGWSNPEFVKLLNLAQDTPSDEQRGKILQEAEELLISEMPIAPIYFYTGSFLKKKNIKGVYLSELNDVDFKWTYIEEEPR